MAEVNLPAARATFAGLVKIPDFTPAKVNLARVSLMLGDVSTAEKTLRGILDKQPTLEPALGMLSAIYRQNGQPNQSIALYKKAHTADPANVRVTVTLAELYLRANDPQKSMDL